MWVLTSKYSATRPLTETTKSNDFETTESDNSKLTIVITGHEEVVIGANLEAHSGIVGPFTVVRCGSVWRQDDVDGRDDRSCRLLANAIDAYDHGLRATAGVLW